MFLKRNGDLRVDKIPLETSPINKAFKTFEDQGADQCNVKRSKGRSRARFSFAQKLLSTKTKSQNIYTCFTFIEQFGATMTNQVQNNLKKTHQKETFDQVGPGWIKGGMCREISLQSGNNVQAVKISSGELS